MAKLTEKQWIEIKTKYQMGKPIREIAREYDYDSGNLSRKAKKDGWIHGEIQQMTTLKANSINEIVETTKKIQRVTSLEQRQIIDKEILNLCGLKRLAIGVQIEVMDLVRQVTNQAKGLLINNPSGLYVKSQSDNLITYGRNTEIIKDLASVVNGINAMIRPKSDITINNNQQNNILDKLGEGDYSYTEEFIVDRFGNIKLDKDGKPIPPADTVSIYIPDNGRGK